MYMYTDLVDAATIAEGPDREEQKSDAKLFD